MARKSGGSTDLGKLVSTYGGFKKFPGALMGGMLLVALSVVGWSFMRNDEDYSAAAPYLAGVFALIGVALPVLYFFVERKKLMLHKRGMVYQVGGSRTVLYWDEVKRIIVTLTEVGETGTAYRDRETGELLDVKWDRYSYTMEIRGQNDRKVYLGANFLQLCGNPRMLMKNLELFVGDRLVIK